MTVAANSEPRTAAPQPAKRARNFWRVIWFALVIATVSVVAGFFYFASLVQQSANATMAVEEADGIIVLTGGSARIHDGISLLREKRAARLLISGVNPRITANQLARRTGTARSLFTCCIDLGYAAQNTLGNAVEGARWATDNGFERLILVTSAYHMPRTMLEFERRMPGAELHPWPVSVDAYNSESWWRTPETMRVLIGEYGKFLLAAARMRVGEATSATNGTMQAGTN